MAQATVRTANSVSFITGVALALETHDTIFTIYYQKNVTKIVWLSKKCYKYPNYHMHANIVKVTEKSYVVAYIEIG